MMTLLCTFYVSVIVTTAIINVCSKCGDDLDIQFSAARSIVTCLFAVFKDYE